MDPRMSSGSEAPDTGSTKRSKNTHIVEQDLFADFGLGPITPKDVDASMASHSSTSIPSAAPTASTPTSTQPKSTPAANQTIARRNAYKQNHPTLHPPSTTSTPSNHYANHFATNPNPNLSPHSTHPITPTPTTAMCAYLTDIDRANTHIKTSLTALEAHTDAKLKALNPKDPRRNNLASQFLHLKQASLALQTAVLKMRGPLVEEARREAAKKAAVAAEAKLGMAMRGRQKEGKEAERK